MPVTIDQKKFSKNKESENFACVEDLSDISIFASALMELNRFASGTVFRDKPKRIKNRRNFFLPISFTYKALTKVIFVLSCCACSLFLRS